MPDPIETELKLSLSEAAFEKLSHSELLKSADAPRTQRLVATYFDTPDHALARAGLTLRVRAADEERRQTVKTEGDAGAAKRRGEWEWRIASDAPDLSLLAGTPAAAFADADLAPVCVTEVTRTARVLALDSARIEADFDVGEIRAGDKRAPLRELELELREGPPGALYRLALALHAEAPFVVETESKAARGRRLATGETLRAGKPAPAPLPRDVSGAEAFRRIVSEALGHMLGGAAAASEGDAEGVHQWRVGLRRLRSALKLFAPLLEPAALAPFDARLQALGRRVGVARDWSVFCDVELRKAFPGVEAPDWRRLVAEAAARKRDAAFAESATLAQAPDFTALTLALAAWAQEAAERPRLVGDPRLDQPIRRLAPGLLAELARKAAKRARKARDGDPVAVHDLRKALKKWRFGLEFLDGLHDVREETRKQLKKLLKQLGRLNDAATAARLAADLGAADVALTPAVAAPAARRDEIWRESLPRAAARAQNVEVKS